MYPTVAPPGLQMLYGEFSETSLAPYHQKTWSCICSANQNIQQQLPGIKRELMSFASFSFYSLLTIAINRFLKSRKEASIDVFSFFVS